MGRFTLGGIESHLSELSLAISWWLRLNQPGLSEEERSDIEGDAKVSGIPLPVEQPEPLTLAYMARKQKVPVFNGSIQDWPYIALLEQNTVFDAEQEFEALMLENARRKAAYLSEVKSSDKTLDI